MNWFKKFISKFVCGYIWAHEYVFVRNIYGDEINQCGGYRSLWKCSKCGKYRYSKSLYNKPSKNLKETLSNLYNEYYENKHIDWTKEHEELLSNITNSLINAAGNGLNYAEILFVAYTKTNDIVHFKQWLTDNKLDYMCELYNQNEEYDEINQYKFNIGWVL